MTATQDPTPTPKQRVVLRELEHGRSPTEIAKRLKTTSSTIHGHMRRMRQAGIELPVSSNGGSAQPEAPAEPVAHMNGDGAFDQRIRDDLMAAIEAGNARLDKIDSRTGEMLAEVEQLKKERDAIDARQSGYERALEALV